MFAVRLRTLAVLALAFAVLGVPAAGAAAQENPAEQAGPTVEILQLEGRVDPPIAGAVRGVLADAAARRSELVVIQLTSPGGLAIDAEEAVAAVRDSPVPVVVWVGPGQAEARGAAALLLLAADVPVVSRDARIGPLCPLSADRGCPPDVAALAGGPAAQRIVRASLSGREAADAGLAALVAEGLQPLLVELDGRSVDTPAGRETLRLREDEVTVRFHSLGLLDRIQHATLNPALVYLLLLAVVLLVAFELFQPGFGVAGVAALALAPLLAYGFAVLPVEWWAAGVLLAGAALLAVDLAIAGLGVPTAVGIAAFTAGSWWLFPPALRLPGWLVALGAVTAGVFFVFVMTVVLRAQAGPDPEEGGDDLVGRPGVVRSALNPEGHVFVAGALWRARWAGAAAGRVRAGTPVRVHGVEDGVLLVDALEQVGKEPAAARD